MMREQRWKREGIKEIGLGSSWGRRGMTDTKQPEKEGTPLSHILCSEVCISNISLSPTVSQQGPLPTPHKEILYMMYIHCCLCKEAKA